MLSAAQLRTAFTKVPPNIQGMSWIVLSGLIFSSFMALVRYAGSTMDPVQLSFLRYAFGLLFLARSSFAYEWPRCARFTGSCTCCVACSTAPA